MIVMKVKILSILVLFLFVNTPLWAQTREPAVAGAFYPDNPEKLKEVVLGYVNNALIGENSLPKGELIGFVSPHAGYAYSGPIAGYDYKLLEGKVYDTVVLIGPNHRVYGFNDIAIWNKGSFKTPLGDVQIDEELANAIINENQKRFLVYEPAQKEEHSLEVQLPFLQVVLKDFKLVPIVMGDYSAETCKQLAKAILKNEGTKKVLVIASTDLSHDMLYDKAVEMDKTGLGCIVEKNIDALIEAEAHQKTSMCGFGPVMTLLYVIEYMGNAQGVLLKYANSGDITGDKKGRIVGYGAVAFFKDGENMNKDGYTIKEKKSLLKLARDTITDYLTTGKKKDYPVFSEKFKENRGVFVTLNENQELRGCIGYIEPIKPLQDAVIDNAVNAATQDPRFSPVTAKELPYIEIEISVLTPPSEIKGHEDFVVGKHGIIIKKGFYSAVFLPQVAPEQGWTKEETLSHLCMKAGLSANEWQKPGMKFFVFTAEVFSEKEVGDK
jgi:AmmeMemoRadiSam system protein B/AmmeMemoRadiSam system protein A